MLQEVINAGLNRFDYSGMYASVLTVLITLACTQACKQACKQAVIVRFRNFSFFQNNTVVCIILN